MDEFREFNPYGLHVITDQEPEDRTTVRVDDDEETWPEISQQDKSSLIFKRRIDGLIVASSSMKIGKNNGDLLISSYPTVFDRHLDRYKGLRDFFGYDTRHLYEFSLCLLGGGMSLCAVIATSSTVRIRERPVFTQMVQEYHQSIRRAILRLPANSLSYVDNLLATNTPIHIYKEDWERVCDFLSEELAMAAERLKGQNVFPPTPRFYFVAKVLGQNLLLDDNDNMSILSAYNCAINVNLLQDYSIAVHCATDAELDNHILFWNPNRVSKSFGNAKPAVLYHVGLIPGLANLTYADVKTDKFSYVQYYSKLFAGCHRDPNNIFMANGVARSLYNRYIEKISGTKSKPFRNKDKFINDTEFRMPAIFKGLRESCTVTTPARLEAVWSKHFKDEPNEDIRTCILEAFEDFQTYIHREEQPFFEKAMLVSFDCDHISARLQPWITVIENTVIDLSKAVQAVENENQLWAMDPKKIISIDNFCAVQVAEFLLHYLLKGKPHKSYPTFLGDYVGIPNDFLAHYENYETYAQTWPFINVSMNNLRLVSDHPSELREKLNLMTGIEIENNKFISFAESRKRFFELTPNFQQRSSGPDVFKTLAEDLFDLIIFVQKKRTSVAEWGETSLKMLFLEKKDFTRRVLHLSVEEFINKLAYPQEHSLPMFPKTKEVSDILVSLKSDLARFRSFRTVLCKLISEKIWHESYPLRFSFGKLHEVYVYADCELFPPTSDALKILDRGIIDANQGRIPCSQIDIRNIVEESKTWLKTNSFQDFFAVATAIQDIFDKKRIRSRTRIPALLKDALSKTYTEDPNANSDEDAPVPDSNPNQPALPSNSGFSLGKRKKTAKKPTSNPAKKRNKSLTRSATTRASMIKHHAKRKQMKLLLQQQQQENDDGNEQDPQNEDD